MKKRIQMVILVASFAMALFVIFNQDNSVSGLAFFGDVRGKSLQGLDLQDQKDMLITQRFDSKTVWPTKLPASFDPERIMGIGKDPGLGIRHLHAQGITGKGVNVAIIDGPLRLDHVEYKDRIAYYRSPRGIALLSPAVYHASMVTSILAGATTGVAPSARIHYFVGNLRHPETMPSIIHEIIIYNRSLPEPDKIKVLSISLGNKLPDWLAAEEEATKEGISVITTAGILGGVLCPLDKDRDNPASYQHCYGAESMGLKSVSGSICVPVDNRTFADYQSRNGYIFNPRGGMSEGAPYLAGVIALGYQVDPALKPTQVEALLRRSSTPFGEAAIVNPAEFIRLIKQEVGKK